MPILTTINNVPLFSTPTEALNYGRSKGLSGYHTHVHNGVTGYMGGRTHAQAVNPTQTGSTPSSTNRGGGY